MRFIGLSRSPALVIGRVCGLLFTAALCLAALNLSRPVPVAAAPLTQAADEGKTLFAQKCAACHTIGGGDLVGPDLRGVVGQRDRAWLTRWLAEPDKMLAEGDPIATAQLKKYKNVPMPNQALTPAQVTALLAYLETAPPLSAAAAPAPVSLAASRPGDPLVGKNLFTGVSPLQNSGPACLACHNVAGAGALGGGALGPNLTLAFNKYGDAGLASLLATLPFPTMNPIYGSRPLAAQEQADLKAFLQTTVTEQPSQALGWLVALALGGTGGLLALAQVIWRRRLTGVRRPLVAPRTRLRSQMERSRGTLGG